MRTNLGESGDLPCRGTSALFRGIFRSKGIGGTSTHYNVNPATAQLFFRIIISVHQHSVQVTGWCEEFAQQISDHSSSNTEGILWSRWTMNQNLKSHPLLCQFWLSHLWSMFQPEETRCSNMEKTRVQRGFSRGGHQRRSRRVNVSSLGTGVFINTKHVEFEGWRPPLVDADWHAFSRATYKGIEGEEWEALYYYHDR